jgi:hypothetical protein
MNGENYSCNFLTQILMFRRWQKTSSGIDDFNNTILKEYEMCASQGVTIHASSLRIDLKTGEQQSIGRTSSTYTYQILTGPFVGRDQRDVIAEAIAWWGEYLNRVDARAKAIRLQGSQSARPAEVQVAVKGKVN